jgi:hypothetical protein
MAIQVSYRTCTMYITINVPVVYVAWDVMVLMRANPLQELLEEVDPESRFFRS